MSITDELRKYAQDWRETPNLMDDLDAGDIDGLLGDLEHIAGRIDAEHERTVGFCKRLEDAAAKREDVEIFGVEYTALPLDADGAPIHVGDTVYLDDGRKAEVRRIQLSERENSICFDVCGDFFSFWSEHLTHTAPDSFERIADELVEWCDDADVDGDACEKPRDLADRIRKLAATEGER